MSSRHHSRQFWGSSSSYLINPNPNSNSNFNPQFNLDVYGCDYGHKCVWNCACFLFDGCEVVIECGMSSNCGNRDTQNGVSLQLNIVRVLNKGWGFFAAQFIRSGQFVSEYAGELLTTKEAREQQQIYDQLQ